MSSMYNGGVISGGRQTGGQRGIATAITLIVLFGVTVLTLNTVLTSRMNMTSATNYRNRIQSFYGADGMMTLLAQEMIDKNEDLYLSDAVKTIGFNIASGGRYSYNKNTGIDSLRGAGLNSGGTSDQLFFAYEPFSGDIDISVRLVSFSSTTGVPSAGIMFRTSLSATSKDAVIARAGNNPVTMKVRKADGAALRDITSYPSWYTTYLRLKKTGNIVTGYRSDNGSSWTLTGSDTVAFGSSVYAGLVVGSGSSSEMCTVLFTDLHGMIRRSYSDSVVFTVPENIHVRYTVNETGSDIFSMATDGFRRKVNGEPVFVSSLTQTLSRKRSSSFVATAVDSAYVPVTLYDYKADLSNPEFNIRSNPTVMKGMINTTLDADRKPVPRTFYGQEQPRSCILYCVSGTGNAWYGFSAATRISKLNYLLLDSSCLNYCYTNYLPGYPVAATGKSWWFSDSLGTWFRPSDAPGAQFDSYTGRWSGLKNRPLTSGGTAPFEWVGQNYNANNPYATIVVYDSLKFREKPSGSGIFVFGDSLWSVTVDTQYYVKGCNTLWSGKDRKFMPLKGRGFGYDAVNYTPPVNSCKSIENFGFTMEMHRLFTYKTGQVFTFAGDDDVWVFINGRLLIDLGGIHGVRTGSVRLDTLGLTEGEQYWVDFFYCERYPTESNIYITTNMEMFVPPQGTRRSWKRDYGDLD